MRRMRGLSTRLIVAIGLLAVLQLAVFVVLLVTLRDLSTSDREARAAASVSIAASDTRIALAQHDLLDLRADGAALAHSARVAGVPSAMALAADVRAYAAAGAGRLTAPGMTARERSLDDGLARLVARQRFARETLRDHVDDLTRLAWIAGATGVAATLLCAFGLLAYLRRALLRPLRAVASTARRLAAGDLRARVGGHDAIGEVGDLARTFDQMAGSLEESRAVLERQNRELAQQQSDLIEAVRSAREGATILRAVLDSTPDAIALLDETGAVVVDNPPMRAARAAFGVHGAALDPARATLATDGAAEQRDEVVLPGTPRTFARYAAPVHDSRRRLIGRLLMLREVTGEREAERAKEDFFALVSHELRTPLTAILGYVELVLSDDVEQLPAEHARHLEVIERNARRLLRLVGDLLFAAHVEGGPLLLEPGTVDLRQLVRDAVELAYPHAEEAGVGLEARVEPVAPCVGDHDRLAQVLDNLVSNALKFSPPGGHVVVGLTQAGGRARIEVTDTGVGIPAADLPRLFDRFYRARNATGGVPGLGLGLMIVRAIVEGHGGTVTVESDVDVGTTFVVELPLRAPDGGARTAQDAARAGGR